MLDRGTLLNSKLFVTYNEQTETLEIKWEGSVSSNEVRQGYSLIMEYVQRYKPVKWLLDFHNRDKIKRTDQRWVFKNFFPEALRIVSNDVFVAVILPIGSSHELVQELDGDELIQEDNFMIINHFLYREAAQRWLELDKSVKAGA
ncbi:hypothetical protein [Pontibacter cellulosilyticus]|uniref:hypothetical protein n=1 Tax=Pontibacter cellulosilyticus TaxID=1720253 RepID=UPI001E3C3D7F|nr:hypothetical protein [Pontibacter cellulosilyticus]